MQWTLNENSLFAVLLRSRWWVSFSLAIGFSAAGFTLLPKLYSVAGLLMGVPFAVIGCIAAWKQFQAPSNARVEKIVEQVRAMAAGDFTRALQDAYRRDGFEIHPASVPGADFEIRKDWRRSLVSCKRWKVARTGVEPLRELFAAKEATEAHQGIYVAVGEVTDTAHAFAAKNGIQLVGGAELARLMPVRKR